MQIRPEDIIQTGSLNLLAKKAVEGFITGFHKSPFQGYSVEFAEHRQYNSGESTKNIDWKLFARSDKLYNKQYDEETNLRCHFLIDASPSMQLKYEGLLTKLQYAISMTASFLELLKKQRDASSLCFFDNEILEFTKVSSSTRHYKEIMSKMEHFLNFKSQKTDTDISATIHQIANQVHRRGLVVLFTDFFDKDQSLTHFFDSIRHLKYHKHEVIIFHILHKKSEFNFDFGNVPVRFEDPETGESIKLLPHEIKVKYQESMNDFQSDLIGELHQHKIEYVPVDISGSLNQSIVPFLVKRKKMR